MSSIDELIGSMMGVRNNRDMTYLSRQVKNTNDPMHNMQYLLYMMFTNMSQIQKQNQERKAPLQRSKDF